MAIVGTRHSAYCSVAGAIHPAVLASSISVRPARSLTRVSPSCRLTRRYLSTGRLEFHPPVRRGRAQLGPSLLLIAGTGLLGYFLFVRSFSHAYLIS